MLLTISHTSTYHYDQPVAYAVQRLRLQPSSSSTQAVRAWNLDVVGATLELSYDDAFSNRTDLLRSMPQTSEIIIHAVGQVDTKNTAGVFGAGTGTAPLWVYLRQTNLTNPGEALRSLAADLNKGGSRLDLLHNLSAGVSERVAYVPDSTDVATTAEAALASGSGVCQDHTHIFVSAARLLGVPARYVSGYLLMEDRAEQTATHAWAEAYIEDLGWVGFDASNGVAPDEKYVRLACGLDYSQAAPITGMRRGSSAESLTVALNVEQ